MAAASSAAAGREGAARGVLIVVATAAVYLVAAKLGLSLAFQVEQVTMVWPPTGIALAAVVLLGPRWTWPGIACGAFLANVTAREPVGTALTIALGNTLEAVVGAGLLARAGFRPTLRRLRDVLALAGLAAAGGTLISATIGVLGLCAGGVQPWSAALHLWQTWWIGDALGALVVGPLLFVWLSREPESPDPDRRLEAIALGLATLATTIGVFTVPPDAPLDTYPVHYAVFPLAVWGALRFGPRGTATVTFLVAAVAILSTVAGRGPFATTSRHESLLMLQLFMGVVAMTGLLLGAAIAERDDLRRRGAHDLETLQESEERLRVALEAGRMGVWDWDLLTQQVRWSDNLEKIHGLAPGMFAGTYAAFEEVVHPDDREHVGRAIEEALRDGTGYDAEFRSLRADGGVGWISAKGRVMRDATGRAVRMLGVGMDVTERRRLADELEARARDLAVADRRKDEFLAMLAHELRNPLAPLATALHLLAEDGADRARILGIAERQSQQLARLVDDLLDASRITQGKIALRPESVWLADVVARAIDAAKPAIDVRGQAFRVTLPREPVRLSADPARLAQVISNLLDNAAKYTPEGGTVELVAECEGDEVVLRVRDTGAGLAPELLANVFDLFVQGDRSLDRGHGGLGIGLTVVRRLVELHGGRVEARSAGAGKGSEFVVRLPQPRVATAEGVVTEGPREDPPVAAVASGLKVLIVEDNRDAAEVLGTLIELWGHEVYTAFEASAALDLFDRRSPDVIVSDVGLPRMDGYELARRVRARPGGRRTVLVALSGYGRDGDKRAAHDAGFDHHIVKPPDLTKLAELLEQVAAERGAETEASAGR
jgi:PAS domain S-box-containing protein